jgi:hypothetical protein
VFKQAFLLIPNQTNLFENYKYWYIIGPKSYRLPRWSIKTYKEDKSMSIPFDPRELEVIA